MIESAGLGVVIALSICEIVLMCISDHLDGIETALKEIAKEHKEKED